MATFVEDKERRMIPRWRGSADAVHMGETKALPARKSPDAQDDAQFDQRVRDWSEKHDFNSASELIGSAIVLGRHAEAADAAKFLRTFKEAYPNLLRLADHVLGDSASLPDPESFPETDAEHIHRLRAALKRDPRNGLVWIDLARIYSTHGRGDKAQKATRIALNLAPESRFVLRSAARLFVHLDDPEFAHRVLLKAESLEYDPWLMAAEIAVASVAERASVCIKAGKRALASDRFSAIHSSELAGAVASMELANGSTKLAAKLFKRALIDPTENAVAQARWASKVSGIEFDRDSLKTLRAFEARAWENFYAGRWSDGLIQAVGWSGDEPFSARPFLMAAYLAGTMTGDHGKALILTQAGLRANQHHPVLLNNLIFYLLELNRVEEAVGYFPEFRGLEIDASTKVAIEATFGMACFRMGDAASGREHYQQAVDAAVRLRDVRLTARAAIHLALEEIRIESNAREPAIRRAIELSETVADPDIAVLLARLQKNSNVSTNSSTVAQR